MPPPGPGAAQPGPAVKPRLRRNDTPQDGHRGPPRPLALADLERRLNESTLLDKRATYRAQETRYWELSQLSMHSDHDYLDNPNVMRPNSENPSDRWYKYYYSPEAGDGQFVYTLEDDVHLGHEVWSRLFTGSPGENLTPFSLGILGCPRLSAP